MPPKRRENKRTTQNTKLTNSDSIHLGKSVNYGPMTRRQLKNDSSNVYQTQHMPLSSIPTIAPPPTEQDLLKNNSDFARDLKDRNVRPQPKYFQHFSQSMSQKKFNKVSKSYSVTEDVSSSGHLNGRHAFSMESPLPDYHNGNSSYTFERSNEMQGKKSINSGSDLSQSERKMWKYLAEFLMTVYFALSWICVLLFKNEEMSIDSLSESNRKLFSTFEEGLIYKAAMCLTTGLITDFLSWKITFYLYSSIWMYLFCFLALGIEVLQGLLKVVMLLCLSSSPILISLIGLRHIWGRENCLLPVVRLQIVSYVFPLYLQLYPSRHPLKFPTKTALSESGNAVLNFFYTFASKYGGMVSSSHLFVGCATCLMLIPVLSDAKLSRTSAQHSVVKDDGSCRSFREFFSMALLKVLVCFPSSLCATLYSSSTANPSQTAMWMIVFSVLVQCLHFPRPSQISSQNLVAGSCGVLIASYGLLGTFSEWTMSAWATLIIYISVNFFRSTFACYVLQRSERNSSIILGSLLSLHLFMRFSVQKFRLHIRQQEYQFQGLFRWPQDEADSEYGALFVVKYAVHLFSVGFSFISHCSHLVIMKIVKYFEVINISYSSRNSEGSSNQNETSFADIFENLDIFPSERSREGYEIAFTALIGTVCSFLAFILSCRLKKTN